MKDYFIRELHKDASKDKMSFRFVCGCYVDSAKRQVATFRRRLGSMKQEDIDKYCQILKASMSGSFGRTLFSLSFRPAGLDTGQQKDVCMKIRENIEEADEDLSKLYQMIIDSYETDGNYLILVADCTHDILRRSRDGKKITSTDVFRYILCTICPVAKEKPALAYQAEEKDFSSRILDWVVTSPANAFIFPDKRGKSYYEDGIVLFSRKYQSLDDRFIIEGLGCEKPNAKSFHQEIFNAMMSDIIKDSPEESDIIKNLSDGIKKVKCSNRKNSDKLVDVEDIKQMLSAANAGDDILNRVEESFARHVGEKGYLPLSSIGRYCGTAIKSPNISISIRKGCEDLYRTKTIDGTKYILISLEDGVSINGINIA